MSSGGRILILSVLGSVAFHGILFITRLPEAKPPVVNRDVVMVENYKAPPVAKKPEPKKPEPPKPKEKPKIAKSASKKAYASRKILTATAPSNNNQAVVSSNQIAGSRGTGYGDTSGVGDGVDPKGDPKGTGGEAKVEVPPPPSPPPPPPAPARPKGSIIPDYPEIAQQSGWEGRAVVRAYINESGECTEATISKSTGHQELDDAAIAAVKRTRFQPGTREDKPVATWVKVPITFALQ